MPPSIVAGQLLPTSEGAGKYRVEAIIGEGGFAVVVRARHETLGQRAAIKILLDEHDAQTIKRFYLEARATEHIDSEHVTKVYEVGQLDSGAPYIVMELLEGRDLEALVQERGALPVGEAVEYVLQACEPLAVAHSLGFVHRDIKPSNLFLTMRDDRPFIKLLDFGVSKHAISAAAPITATGDVLGTPHFMSPEQLISSRDVDGRSDIWSLGATLHELLSGHPPFDGPTLAEVLACVLRNDPIPLRQIRDDVPEAVEHAVLRCLEKDPLERYASIAELAAALAPYAPARAVSSAERAMHVLESAPTVRTPPTLEETTRDVSQVVRDLTPRAWTRHSPPAASDPGWSRPVHTPRATTEPQIPPRVDVPAAQPPPKRRIALQWVAMALVIAVCIGGAFLGWRIGMGGDSAEGSGQSPSGQPIAAGDDDRTLRPDDGDDHLSRAQAKTIAREIERAQAALDAGDDPRAVELTRSIQERLVALKVGVPSRLSARTNEIMMKALAKVVLDALRRHPSAPHPMESLADMSAMSDLARLNYDQMWAHRRYPFVVCAGVEFGQMLERLHDLFAYMDPAGVGQDVLAERKRLSLRWVFHAKVAYRAALQVSGPEDCLHAARSALERK